MSSNETRRADRKVAMTLFAGAGAILFVGIPLILLPAVVDVATHATGAAVVAVHRLVDGALAPEETDAVSASRPDGTWLPDPMAAIEEPQPESKTPVRRRVRHDPDRQVIPPWDRRDRARQAPRTERGDRVARRDEARRGDDRRNRRQRRARRSPQRR